MYRFGCICFLNGQSKKEGAAFSWFTFQPDTATMMFNNFFTDGQTQAGSFWFIGKCITYYLFELLKYGFMILRSNTNTGILYANHYFIFLQMGPANNFSGWSKFHRIGNEIYNHLY